MAVTQEGGSLAPAHDSSSLHGSQIQEATLVRSSSDGDVSVSVSPLPVENSVEMVDINGLKNSSCRGEGHQDGDTFLNASMQLQHINGEARQRVRQLWTSVQRLGRENQISEAGVDLLYVELGNILKSLSAEKLNPPQPLKMGQLVLLPSAASETGGNSNGGSAVKALFGSRQNPQLMRCSLSEDQSKLEMTPLRPDNRSDSTALGPSPQAATGRFGLPTTASLMGIISDALQEEPTTRVIRLQGCQVRKLVPKTTSSDFDESISTQKPTGLRRFQLLVPYKTPTSILLGEGARVDTLFPSIAPVPYESLIFEVPVQTTSDEETDAEVDSWVNTLNQVCRFQLHRLENALREAPTIDRYRETLLRYFPVCVSLSWLHNRSDLQTQMRRASANLSMVQIAKDLGRDKVLLDDRLFSAVNSQVPADGIDSDSVSDVVKCLVTKVLEFERTVAAQHKSFKTFGAAPSSSHQPSSPVHRFANNDEARALAFVERVLQGSSRTQSGGDIYDAISFFCQQDQVSICPVSHEARPVQMRVMTDIAQGVFQVEVEVCMRFKLIELTSRSPSSTGLTPDFDNDADNMCEWAVLEGTLSRQFTLGQLPAHGTITINYLPKGSE